MTTTRVGGLETADLGLGSNGVRAWNLANRGTGHRPDRRLIDLGPVGAGQQQVSRLSSCGSQPSRLATCGLGTASRAGPGHRS